MGQQLFLMHLFASSQVIYSNSLHIALSVKIVEFDVSWNLSTAKHETATCELTRGEGRGLLFTLSPTEMALTLHVRNGADRVTCKEGSVQAPLLTLLVYCLVRCQPAIAYPWATKGKLRQVTSAAESCTPPGGRECSYRSTTPGKRSHNVDKVLCLLRSACLSAETNRCIQCHSLLRTVTRTVTHSSPTAASSATVFGGLK